MDSQKIKLIIISILALFAALYLGISAATAQMETVGWVLGAGVLITCLLLGPRIWLLIPFLGSLHLTLMIPGRPSTIAVAQTLVVFFSLLMFMTRKLPIRLRFTELEVWMFLLVLCVLQVYLRNPIGVNLFGSNQVGGRPYALFVVALIAALIMCGLVVPAKELRTALKLSIVGGILNFTIGLISLFWFPLGYWFGVGGDETTSSRAQMKAIDTENASRIDFVRDVAHTLALTVSSFKNPLAACFSIRWAPLIIISLAFAGLSGYRNVVASVGMTYVVGTLYRGGVGALFGSVLAGVAAVALLAVTNLAMPLPPNIQRALSFLPGTWNERYVIDSEGSTDWRVEIWQEVLFTDRWIQNKIMGDGLGFSAAELARQEALMVEGGSERFGVSGFDFHRESILANGDYHSGPVSAVRTIGYVGLLVMVLAQIRLVVHAHRQILRCKGTEWFPVALFFCIPIIWFPFYFAFIFGGFQVDGVGILMNLGMLRMLENNLPLPAYVTQRARHHGFTLQNRDRADARATG